MSGRKPNNPNVRGNNFNPNFRKPGMPNQRNRFGGGVGGVNPWLPQSNSGNFGNLARNIGADPQAQLALASNLINNLLGADSPLHKFPQPPPLFGMGNPASSFGGPSFTRDRFGIPRSNAGKVQKRGDFKNFVKNKRFGNDRKNQSTYRDQSNKKVTGEQTAVKKDVDKNEEIKVENNDVDQIVSEKEDAVKNDSTSNGDTEENKEPENDESKVSYSEVPFALLFCHICRKHMWDDASFEKHLEGKPHKVMVEELERSYDLRVELLRHEMRVMEQQREHEIQRAFRKGKNKAKLQQRDFCAMCNLNFLGLLPAHRKNERHQRLKKFLHPKCRACTKEFYTRLEWDEHKLSAAHLKKIAEVRKQTRPDLENSEFDIIDFIEDINDEFEAEIIDVKVSGKRETMDELSAVKTDETAENKESNDDSSEANENPEETSPANEKEVQKDETEKEEKADDDEDFRRLPRYVAGNPIGENFLTERKGFLCRACNRFMLNQEDNKIHCQTITHYNNIIKILKAQYKISSNRKRPNVTKNEEKEDDGCVPIDASESKRQKVDEPTSVDSGSVSDVQIKAEPNENELEPNENESEPNDDESQKHDTENSETPPEPEKDTNTEPSVPGETEEPMPETTKLEVAVELPRIDESLTPVTEKKITRSTRTRRGRRI